MPDNPTLVLLQSRIQFWPEENTGSIIVAIGLILLFLLILVVGYFTTGKSTTKRTTKKILKHSRFMFSRTAASIGLNKEQIKLLDNLVRICKVKQPLLIFSNSGLLDDILKKGIYSINRNREATEEEKEWKMRNYFKIKEIIERNSKSGGRITSTTLIRPGQSITISFPDGNQIQTKAIANLKGMLLCAIPPDQGSFAWQRGTKIEAFFWRRNDSGYVFSTKILGTEQIKGQPCLLVQHSRTLKKNQQRKFRRKSLARNCFFYPIEIATVGKEGKAKKRAFVQKNFRHLGNFSDISAGGCSINCQAPLVRGRLLMIEFEIRRGDKIICYGKVRRTERIKGMLSVMRIMFTKVSSRNLNSIYSYIYDYSKPLTASHLQQRLPKIHI